MGNARRFRLALVCAVLVSAPASATERTEIPDRYKWNLTALYPTDAAWSAARTSIEGRLPGMSRFQGRLARSADTLYAAIQHMMDLERDLGRLYTYASQKSDEDARISRYIEMREIADQLGARFNAARSFVRPEIIGIGGEEVRNLITGHPKLGLYAQWLDNLLRAEPHTLTAAEEKIVAQAGSISGAGATIRDLFTNAEMPYPEVVLSSGDTVRLDPQGYTRYRALPDRADRTKVFQAFWRRHGEYRGTLGAALNAQVQAHVFERDARRFKSCLASALFAGNIPTRVYTQLLADVQANLPTLHRYLKLRRRMMGLKQLRYEDLYAPIVQEVDLRFTPEAAMTIAIESLAPLGKPYVETLRGSFTSGWIDWMPTTGKASGAYSTGAYGVHPYQLQNFTGLYDEVGTFVHESGHSLHTWLSDQSQPYVYHDYATFVAEVASTLNENLLFHHMLDRTKDKATRLFLLGSYLDNLRGTLFRQVLFADFELRIHEQVEKGQPLSGENLDALYLSLVRKYCGHAQGVCHVDSTYASEWAYIDHFYYNFYVYQYATSIVASTALANGIHEERRLPGAPTKRRDAYLRMLSSGSSRYPIDLLKEAGVDMTTSAPFKASMLEMNRVMDEMEKLLR